MRAYYGTRWRACGDHSPRATAPQQTCTHFLLECAPNELEQLGSHCSCSLSLSRSRLSRDASLFLSATFSLCGYLCQLSLCCSLSLPALFLALCASFSGDPSPSTLAQSTKFDHHHDHAFGFCHLFEPPRLCALPQLALPTSIANCKNRQQNINCL